MDPPLANGAPSRSESEQLRNQINDADGPRRPADLSHLEPGSAERKPQPATAIAVHGGRNRRRTATPPKGKAAATTTNGVGDGRPAAAALGAPRGGRRRSLHPSDERQARHPRDEALTPQEGGSRLQSPDAHAGGAQKPAVDFDGLSWPSMCFVLLVSNLLACIANVEKASAPSRAWRPRRPSRKPGLRSWRVR